MPAADHTIPGFIVGRPLSRRTLSPAERLMNALEGVNLSKNLASTRLQAAFELRRLGHEAQPVVTRLGAAGAKEPSALVQIAIVEAVRAAGGPEAGAALTAIDSKARSGDVRAAIKTGFREMRGTARTADDHSIA